MCSTQPRHGQTISTDQGFATLRTSTWSTPTPRQIDHLKGLPPPGNPTKPETVPSSALAITDCGHALVDYIVQYAGYHIRAQEIWRRLRHAAGDQHSSRPTRHTATPVDHKLQHAGPPVRALPTPARAHGQQPIVLQLAPLLCQSDSCTDVDRNKKKDESNETAGASFTKTSSVDASTMPTEHDEDVKTSKHVEPSRDFPGMHLVLTLGTPSNCI